MKLYSIKRIETIEKSQTFRAAKKEASKRKIAATKAAATKRERIDQYFKELKIEVPAYEREELVRIACDNYNSNVGTAAAHRQPLQGQHRMRNF